MGAEIMVRDEKSIEVGHRIAQGRKEAGDMTQEELALLVGVSPRSIQAYEAGEVIPYKYMRQLESALQKPVAWLLHGDESLAQRNDQLQEIVELLREIRDALSPG